MENEICEVLRGGALGFNQLLDRLRKLRCGRNELSGSAETLSAALKTLQEAALVKRDLRTRKYDLTEFGALSAAKPSQFLRVKPLQVDAERRLREVLEIGQGDFIRFLVEAHVQALERSGRKQIELPRSFVEQTSDRVKQFANGRKSAMRKLWVDVVTNFIFELSSLLPAFMLMHLSYAGSVSEEDTALIVHKAITLWARFRIEQIQRTLSNYLSHPEVLAAMELAIRKHNFHYNLVDTGFEQVCRTLKQQMYL